MRNDGDLFLVGFVMAAIIAAFIPDRAITNIDIDIASTRCNKNDGVLKLRAGYFQSAIVWCNDGAMFDMYPIVEGNKP